jgi:hypothetical protein
MTTFMRDKISLTQALINIKGKEEEERLNTCFWA